MLILRGVKYLFSVWPRLEFRAKFTILGCGRIIVGAFRKSCFCHVFVSEIAQASENNFRPKIFVMTITT